MALEVVISFDEFDERLRNWARDNLRDSETVGKCIDAIDNVHDWNHQGHIRQAFYGVQFFLIDNPDLILLFADQPIEDLVEYDGDFLDRWRAFLEENSSEYQPSEYDMNTLYNQTSEAYGGATSGGGGGTVYIKRVTPLVARLLRESGLGMAPPERVDQEDRRRRRVVETRIIRDSSLVRELKELYEDHCQICGERFMLAPEMSYSEGHHVRPLGEPHGGPDEKNNILILCPNHHAVFDAFKIALVPDSPNTALDAFGEEHDVNFRAGHAIDQSHIDYLAELFDERNPGLL